MDIWYKICIATNIPKWSRNEVSEIERERERTKKDLYSIPWWIKKKYIWKKYIFWCICCCFKYIINCKSIKPHKKKNMFRERKQHRERNLMLACWTEIERKTQAAAAATFTVDILCVSYLRCSDESSCSFSNIAHVYQTTTEIQISQTPGFPLLSSLFTLAHFMTFLPLLFSVSHLLQPTHSKHTHTGEIGIFPTCKIELLYKLVQVNKIDATSISLDDCCCFCNQRISFYLLKGNKTYLCCRYLFCWMSFQKRNVKCLNFFLMLLSSSSLLLASFQFLPLSALYIFQS